MRKKRRRNIEGENRGVGRREIKQRILIVSKTFCFVSQANKKGSRRMVWP